MTAKGVDVEVMNTVPYIPHLAGHLSAKIKRYAHIPKQEHYDGIKVYHPKFLRAIPGSILDRLLFQLTGLQSRMVLAAMGKTVDLRQYQLIHAHNLFPDGATAYLLSRKYRIPYVITLHDVDQYNSLADKGMLKELSRKIISHAKKVFVVSNRVKNNIISQLPEQNVQLLYNTFYTEDKQLQGRGRNKKIVAIASLIERKGIHILLQAFHRIASLNKDYELVIIGNGSEMESLIKLTQQLNLQERVTFRGTLRHQEAMEELANASIFCLPSWDEAFGVVYAEAMSYGIPIIGCRGEGIGDLVTHLENGMLVESQNIDELTEALQYLISNVQEAWLIGNRGKESIDNLHPRTFGGKLLEQYEEVLSS
ncbi:glycosyl transferase [Cohnella abietis]|uniref:Glycosyl transferase n=1 Tax=Cohnella abietis TaxID=2507935 RepID=A0A3T1D108_9BACL|nr:glycosyl transferase [Cohnella abietis]